MAAVDGSDMLEPGQDALARGAWAEARTCFEEATATGDAPEAWEGISRAAWWQGDEEATLAARERSYRGFQRTGDARGAARMAAWLGMDHLDLRGDDALAVAWLRRAAQIVEAETPCAEQGWVALMQAEVALLAHCDFPVAQELSERALVLAHSLDDRELEIVAIAMAGCALVAAGAVEDGVRRFDDAAGLAVGTDFRDVLAPAWALCHMVSFVADVGDFHRASQWCGALHTLATSWSGRHYFGACRTAYGTVLTAHGDWPTADEELTTALVDMRASRPGLAAVTAVRLGQLRARQGDREEARGLFESALPASQAVVALGELELEAGDAQAAAEAADRVLRRGERMSKLERFGALELLARARAGVGDIAAASEVAAELEREAERLTTPHMRARAALTTARVRLAAGAHDDARRASEDAADLFSTCAAPYDAACAQLVLADALTALARPERAAAEARAAGQAMAALTGRRTRQPAVGDELTARELEILRLVAQGQSDGEIADRLFLSPHTVHRHVANVRTKLRLPSRAAAVAYAARAGLL